VGLEDKNRETHDSRPMWIPFWKDGGRQMNIAWAILGKLLFLDMVGRKDGSDRLRLFRLRVPLSVFL